MLVPQAAIDHYGFAPYFSDVPMPAPEPEFVCWLDLMGMQNAMLRSLSRTANFAMKLLVAAIPPNNPPPTSVQVCPVIDGLFIHSPNRDDLLLEAKRTVARLAMACISGDSPEHTFLVRGAIAHGPLVKGATVGEDCFRPERYQGPPFGRSWPIGSSLGLLSPPPTGRRTRLPRSACCWTTPPRSQPSVPKALRAMGRSGTGGNTPRQDATSHSPPS